jgi:hypothetical protein
MTASPKPLEISQNFALRSLRSIMFQTRTCFLMFPLVHASRAGVSGTCTNSSTGPVGFRLGAVVVLVCFLDPFPPDTGFFFRLDPGAFPVFSCPVC